MELWVLITIGAAFGQNLRSALQKSLKGRLSTGGATYSRFIYAAPFALAYITGLVIVTGVELPSTNLRFFTFGAIGGVAQIIATFLLVHLFAYRNFAVGNAYSKTETVQTALVGVVILGDPITAGIGLAIGVSLIGVLALSVGKGQFEARSLLTSLTDRATLIGVFSGTMFGISAVSYRAASLSLGGPDAVTQAALTLACVTVFQTIVMGTWLRFREPGEMLKVAKAWRIAILVGLTGMAASACWFTAMTLQNAAYVRAVGQIELVFTFIASTLFFREKSNAVEIAGICLIVSGILMLVLQ
jgi:drug/metabolite transporter (DMT)-like permease